mmetsp:Transcript_8761/g.16540  ORF Transcript_8761/g.16540 Transcript_8761/m.16540 type:complete len:277 (+) Transcript_8761:81-911(+)
MAPRIRGYRKIKDKKKSSQRNHSGHQEEPGNWADSPSSRKTDSLFHTLFAMEYPGTPEEILKPSPSAGPETGSNRSQGNSIRRVASGTFDHISAHIKLLTPDPKGNASGRAEFYIEYSTCVALSSLLYSAVAYVYLQHNHFSGTATFLLVSVCSVFADSITPHSHLANVADRAVATVGGFAFPIRVMIAPGPASISFRLFLLLLLIFCLCFLAWSRSCTTQDQYILRHSLWHAVSALGLCYMAHKDGSGLVHDIRTMCPPQMSFAHGGGPLLALPT